MDEIEMTYSEFRQKLIDLVREVVTQLPELRPKAESLAWQLGGSTGYGKTNLWIENFSHDVGDACDGLDDDSSVQDLKKQLRNLAEAADYATTHGCTTTQFRQYKDHKDLEKAIEEALK